MTDLFSKKTEHCKYYGYANHGILKIFWNSFIQCFKRQRKNKQVWDWVGQNIIVICDALILMLIFFWPGRRIRLFANANYVQVNRGVGIFSRKQAFSGEYSHMSVTKSTDFGCDLSWIEIGPAARTLPKRRYA